MTIEEQLVRAASGICLNTNASVADVTAVLGTGENAVKVEEEEDSDSELDDIDKVRDDLQSTKQMLTLELRQREATERENKRLQSRLSSLQVKRFIFFFFFT